MTEVLNSPFGAKVIKEIVKAIQNDKSIVNFEVIPRPSLDKNATPVLRGDRTLALESWAVQYVLPLAHQIVVCSAMKKLAMLSDCILVINLLHPEMSTSWNRRRELVQQGKLDIDDEMRVARLSLSFRPKCNEALAYRRWLLSNVLLPSATHLSEELDLAGVIADRYQSNYHAWVHRQWSLRHLSRPRPFNSQDFNTTRSGKSASVAAPTLLLAKQDVLFAFTSTSLPIYLHELEINLDFINSHVSDHCGLHHRTFLLSDIFAILYQLVKMSSIKNDDDSVHNNDALAFYSNIKTNLIEFFQDCEENEIRIYIARISNRLNLFDVVMSLIVEELKVNTSLNQLFEYHESLWCFRKFLIQQFCLYVFHGRQHLMGVADAFARQLVIREQTWLNLCVMTKGSQYDSRILTNYCNWLKEVAKLNIVID